MYANFLLGTLCITEAAAARLGRAPLDLIARHAVNDHGCITQAELRRNMLAMKRIGTIVSRFPVDPTDKRAGYVLVVTDEKWEETTVKLEGDDG